jgi:hypothetical protein
VLRHIARMMILLGAACAFANLAAMLLVLWRRTRSDVTPPGKRLD